MFKYSHNINLVCSLQSVSNNTYPNTNYTLQFYWHFYGVRSIRLYNIVQCESAVPCASSFIKLTIAHIRIACTANSSHRFVYISCVAAEREPLRFLLGLARNVAQANDDKRNGLFFILFYSIVNNFAPKRSHSIGFAITCTQLIKKKMPRKKMRPNSVLYLPTVVAAHACL